MIMENSLFLFQRIIFLIQILFQLNDRENINDEKLTEDLMKAKEMNIWHRALLVNLVFQGNK